MQAIEATRRYANGLPLSREAVQLIGHNLVRVYSDGDDLAAREAMLKASFLGAVAFANCRLGAVHGIAHPVGVRYRTPHGVVCAILLPYVMRFNMQDCVEDYARLARDMGIAKKRTSARVMAASLIGMIEELNRKLGIPSKLKEIGLRRDDISAIARRASVGSLRANRRKMTREDIEVLLEANL